MYRRFKYHVFRVLEPHAKGDAVSVAFDWFLIVLIVLNVVLVFLDTFDGFQASEVKIFQYFDLFSVFVFSLEYILRIWTSDLLYESMPKYKARLKYLFSIMALVDLLAILPFYLPLIIPVDLRVLRTIRLLRLLRILKMNRYTTALKVVADVVRSKSSQLISSMAIVFVLMVVASLIMYNIEYDAQPGVFKNAFSGIWWTVATLTTVGYGDIFPVTVWGRILGALIALLGIMLIAVPTGIISSGFIEESNGAGIANAEMHDELAESESAVQVKKQYCPYCGKRIE